MEKPKKSRAVSSGPLPDAAEQQRADQLLQMARADIETVLEDLETQPDGLSEAEAHARLKRHGLNQIARETHQSAFMRLVGNINNPLVLLLLALGVLSFFTGDMAATAVIVVMVLLGVVLRFFQEKRADAAAEKLQAMVSNTATLVRGGKEIEGALAMSRKKVIVKRLNAIQNFGAMDALCTDKTGTLTQGKIVLEKHLDVYGEPSGKVLYFGCLNSFL